MAVLLDSPSHAAEKVDRYTIRMHRSHLKAREEGDFGWTWEQAWKRVVADRDGLIPVAKSDHTVARQRCRSVFKEHYNIENEGHPAGPSSEIHFHDDGSEFEKMVLDTRGWSGDKRMTHDEFMQALHEYVDIKHKERRVLYEMAHTIF